MALSFSSLVSNISVKCNTIDSAGTYNMEPFNEYFVNASSVILHLPTENLKVGDRYSASSVAEGFAIVAPNAATNQVILWENSGYSTLTSAPGDSASIEIVYMGLLFSGRQTFIAKSTNTVTFTPSV